jgi:hypothetical protein
MNELMKMLGQPASATGDSSHELRMNGQGGQTAKVEPVLTEGKKEF